MAQLLLIRGAKQLLTLRAPSGARRGTALQDLAIIEDGSVLIRDGLISQIGTTRRIENLKEVRGAAEIAVNGAVVMPGFTDPAIHLSMVGSELGGRRKSTAAFYESALALLRSCLQHGTLNAQVKIGAGNQDVRSNLALLRQLMLVGNHPVGLVRSWQIDERREAADRLADELAAAVPLLKPRKLAHRLEVTPESASHLREKIWAAACLQRLGVNLQWAGGPTEVLRSSIRCTQPRAVHCSYALSAAERTVLAEQATPVIFSPVQWLRGEQSGNAMRDLVERGAVIALSSGYDEQELPVFNMQTVISLAVLKLGLTAEQAIAASTINAAFAIGLDRVTGSLEVGKQANLLVLNLSDYRELPRRFGTNHVGMAVREGKIVYNRTSWKVSAA